MHNPTRSGRSVSCHLRIAAGLALLAGAAAAQSYPLDGYERTGIGRLESARRIEAGIDTGEQQPPGALLPTDAVAPRLLDRKDLDLPAADPDFTRAVVALLGDSRDRYSIAILDLSDTDQPRYAEHRGDELYNPGSVGKLMVIMGWFQALADLYPDDLEARWQLIRDTVITADEVTISDHHTVRIWDRQNKRLIRKILEPGDRGTVLEYMDWMMSASSNASASVMMEHGILLKQFGRDYPVPETRSREFLAGTPKTALDALLAEFIQSPVARNGFDLARFRQGSLFTSGGKRVTPGTSSHASARELLRYLLRLEQGRIVDQFSSTEIKRLMYVTERRIRYASSPALNPSAVYFKSGSLYKCEPEPGFTCLKYHGNVRNLMNSVAIVESPPGTPRLHYLVALMSNVLRKNSAVDHQTLATRIHRLIETHHAAVP